MHGCAAETQGFLFAAEMIAPANQIGIAGHYRIPGMPGEQIPLQIKVTNHTDQIVEVKFVPMNAYSSQTGIFYQNPDDVNTQAYSLLDSRYGLAQYMTVPDSLDLQPNEIQIVDFSVAVPDIDTGTLLGCIRVIAFAGSQTAQETDNQVESAQMLIDKYQAVDTAVEIILPNPAAPSISVGEVTFLGEKIAVGIQITNQAALIQEGITGDYEIMDSQNMVLFSDTIDNFKMAPMSTFNYPLTWQNKTLEPGTYALSLTLHAGDEVIDIRRNITIDAQGVDEAQRTQQRISPTIKSTQFQWYEVALQVLILIIIVLFIAFIRRKRR